jgi:D-alanyl-lipoteichoic acid acyltransferase DltB (MBOAT superfamily)
MLFNSIIYIFLFLPIVTAAFRLSDRGRSRVLARVLLILATLLFYAAAGLKLVPILIISMLFNYGAGVLIERTARRRRAQYFLVIIAVCVDLAALGYFKYTNFLIENWDIIARSSNSFARIALPLGISFYTFQQIGYLVDVKRGKTTAGGPLSYANFVLFFPQLLAGPIVQRNELAPQFEGEARRDAGPDVLVGLTIFSIGLFKKTVVADTAALYATPVYHAAQIGGPLGLVDSWLGLFAYTAQIYFDFSGYSDMAIGSARMLGILLPINFHSPLRSGTTLEFWRRWHITLGRWVLAYIFQPVALAMARLAANLRGSLGDAVAGRRRTNNGHNAGAWRLAWRRMELRRLWAHARPLHVRERGLGSVSPEGSQSAKEPKSSMEPSARRLWNSDCLHFFDHPVRRLKSYRHGAPVRRRVRFWRLVQRSAGLAAGAGGRSRGSGADLRLDFPCAQHSADHGSLRARPGLEAVGRGRWTKRPSVASDAGLRGVHRSRLLCRFRLHHTRRD